MDTRKLIIDFYEHFHSDKSVVPVGFHSDTQNEANSSNYEDVGIFEDSGTIEIRLIPRNKLFSELSKKEPLDFNFNTHCAYVVLKEEHND